jgi:NAD dependent epimerase/dehydratase family enzyme
LWDESINIAAPNSVTNREFFLILNDMRKRNFCIFPIPGFILKNFVGESSSAILDSQRVYPNKLINSGFQFQYSHLKDALGSEECL